MTEPYNNQGGGYDQAVMGEAMRQSMYRESGQAWELNVHKEIEKFEFLLRGCIRDEDGMIVQIHEPIVNDRGRVAVMFVVRSWVDKTTAMSNWSEYQISRWGWAVFKELVHSALRHGEYWELKKEMYGSICINLAGKVMSILNMAKDGFFMEKRGESTRITETYNPNMNKKNIN